jgi:hypothetical protein
MTNAPTDLLGLRSRLQTLTGLSPVDVGIVGDAAHARSGGYHIGRSGLIAAGVWNSDYSVRLPRDRNWATESASAMDVGAGWHAGHAVWLRWNNLLANALRAGDPALSAVRAINYSPDGSLKWRIDREQSWRTESSGDTVDIHTHVEFYRDTEGHRQQSLDRIAALAQQAITGQAPAVTSGVFMALTDQQQQDLWEWLALLVDPGTPATGRKTDRFHFPPTLMQLKADVDALKAATSAPVPVVLTAEQITAVATALAGLVPTVEELRGIVDAAVKARLDGATVHTAGA